MTTSNATEKYSATLFWNDVIRTFRSRMPLTTHRRGFKAYESSFTGREAVDWLHGYLSAKVGESRLIRREQAATLFEKMYGERLFYPVRPVLKESSRYRGAIYRFTDVPVSSIVLTPLAVKNIGGSVKVTSQSSASAIAKRPSTAMLNGRQVFGALASNEGQNQSAILNYRELSAAEINNFWKQVCLERLRTFFSSDSLVGIIDESEIASHHVAYNATNFTSRGMAKVPNPGDDVPGWALRGMKCLANWPWLNGIINVACYVGFERDVFTTLHEYFTSSGCSDCFIPSHFYHMFLAILDRAEMLDSGFSLNGQKLNGPFKKQFDFTNIDPCADGSLKANGNADGYCSNGSDEFGESSTVGASSDEFRPSSRFGQLTFVQRSVVLNDLPGLVPSPKILAELQSKSKPNDGYPADAATCALSMKCRSSFSSFGPQNPFERLESMNFRYPRLRSSVAFCPPIRSPLQWSRDRRMLSVPFSSYFHSPKVRQLTSDALAIGLLLLPPKNRRWLQLLMRFIERVSANHCLRLDRLQSISNRALMINAFSSCFAFHAVSSSRTDSIRLLSCLVDFQGEIFNLPGGLSESVKARMNQARSSSEVALGQATTFCSRITEEEFRHQAAEHSLSAVLALLDEIVNSEKLSSPERQKRLLSFRKTYPELYKSRFPNDPLPKKTNSLIGRLKERMGVKAVYM
ncbi:DEP domain containing protein [Trichuris trichiura]|uniref:DEP domain containing protein n=1 Tax=Trichuris trichiura TaxID=36087 RepID=A0A077Z4W6_TRITR|nr:DEP domain containing protein [Trichuris trichiura]